MGQTLTHGIYLPDEGERNCYNGLADNWQILDDSVGTIAAHTAALSGKAPLVHTHTKSDITDFPAYGTTAGTICEGNDSRLSDARTPVAHTHGKADITDLFNSANTWTANNTFLAGAYFYNSDSTAATSTLNLRNSKVTKGGTSDSGSQIIQFLDKNNKFLSQITTVKGLSGTTQLQFILGNIDSNDNSISGNITFSLAIDGTKQFLPGSNKTHNLGNSSYQWKTLNGINPGALSLPSEDASSTNLDPTNWNTTGTQYNAYTPPSNGWLGIQVMSADTTDLTGQYLFAGRNTGGQDFWPQGQLVNLVGDFESNKLTGNIFFPVIANKQYQIRIKIGKTQTEGSIIRARFYPCLGNV